MYSRCCHICNQKIEIPFGLHHNCVTPVTDRLQPIQRPQNGTSASVLSVLILLGHQCRIPHKIAHSLG